MHKLLFIGLGGSGGKVLRFTAREIVRTLRDRGWSRNALPECVQLLHIDLPAHFDGYQDADVPQDQDLDRRIYANLATKPLAYRSYDEWMHRSGLLRAMYGCRPHPVDGIGDPYLGAGQRRAVGRLVTACSLAKVDAAIDRAVDALQSSASAADGQTVDRLMNPARLQLQREGHVFVVTSLAGGSGAGMFLDVIGGVLHASRTHAWLRDVHLVAMTPDVASGLAAGERLGVAGNSLAALSEYLCAFNWTGEPTPGEAAVQRSAGRAPESGKRTGNLTFLVGRQNDGGLTFPSGSAVIRSLGRALAAYATTPAVQAYMDTVVVNFQAPGSTQFFAQLRGAHQPVSSFGFGSVGIGTDILGEYAAQRLALAGVRRLLGEERGDRRLDDWVAERTGGGQAERFFERARLRELQPADAVGGAGDRVHDQVLQALVTKDQLIEATTQLRNSVLDLLAAKDSPLDGADAEANSAAAFGEPAEALEQAEQVRRSERARRWTGEVQGSLLSATLDAVATHGLAVGVELLRLLQAQLADAKQQLEGDLGRAQRYEGNFLENAQNLYRSLQAKITGRAPVHTDATTERQKAIFQRIWGRSVADTIGLVDAVAGELVAQLQTALERYANALSSDVGDKGQGERLRASWSDGPVPTSLRPAENELTLIDVTTMPDVFERLVMATTKRTAPLDALSEAVRQVITGDWQPPVGSSYAGTSNRSPVRVRQNWNSSLPYAQRDGESPAKAAFDLQMPLTAILERARDWVSHCEGELATFVRQNLRAYLGPAAVDQADRCTEFVAAFKTACDRSRPLVNIDAARRLAIHGDMTEVRPTLTPLPIEPNHPARAGLEETLLGLGVQQTALNSYFTTDSGGSRIDIFGFMTRSVHPVVVGSLMDPIADEWAIASASAERRQEFWGPMRRARTIEMFVPLHRDHTEAIVRGWYVAAILGYLRGLAGTEDQPELAPEVWSPDGWLAFPRPLLGRLVSRPDEALPALLESVPLALLGVARGDLSTMNAYGRLVSLGGHDARDQLGELGSWLATAQIRSSGEPVPPLHAFVRGRLGDNAAAATVDARREAVLEAIQIPLETIRKVAAAPLDLSVVEPERRWDIAPLIGGQLEELQGRVKGFRPPAAPPSGSSGSDDASSMDI